MESHVDTGEMRAKDGASTSLLRTLRACGRGPTRTAAAAAVLALLAITSYVTVTYGSVLWATPCTTLTNRTSPLSSPLNGTNASLRRPLIDVPLTCALLEERLGKGAAREEDDDPANWRAAFPLCATPFRDQMTAQIRPEYSATWDRISRPFGGAFVEDAYVSFLFGKPYTELAAAGAFRAVQEFSDRPLLVFVSGVVAEDAAAVYWPPEEFDRLVVFEMPPPSLNPWFDKLRASILAPVRRGVVVEADTLITTNADRLFPLLARHDADTKRGFQPLMPLHPDLRLPNCRAYRGRYDCGNPFPYPAERRTVPYMHAHLMFTAASKDFLARTLAGCTPSSASPIPRGYCHSDESALNVRMWEEGAMAAVCMMVPHFSVAKFWASGSVSNAMRSEYAGRPVGFLFVHGCKDPKKAKALVELVRGMRGKPWLLMKGKYLGGSEEEVAAAEAEDACVLH